MVLQVLITSLRQFKKQKLYVFLNLSGLTIGIASALVIARFVLHELSYDKIFPDYESIYRISQNITFPDGSPPRFLAAASPQVGMLLTNEFPQIETIARIRNIELSISVNQTSYSQNITFTDPSFFDIFQFEWLEGDSESGLTDVSSAVIDTGTSQILFGSRSPIGESIQIDDELVVRVVGLVEQLPRNTHLDVGFFVPMQTLTSLPGSNALDNWSFQNYYTYALLPDADIAGRISLESREFFNRYAGEGAGDFFSLSTEPIADIYLNSNRANEMRPLGSSSIVWTLCLTAILIVILASANYVNLTTATSNSRLHEIGVRKSCGASRRDISVQFFLESLMLISIAALFAQQIAYLVLPYFKSFLNIDFPNNPFGILVTAGITILSIIGLTFISASYPSYYVSKFNPVNTIRGAVAGVKGSSRIRSLLVIMQFLVAMSLIIFTLTVLSQISYLSNYDLGYDTENVVTVETNAPNGFGDGSARFRNETSALGVSSFSLSSTVPGELIDIGYFVQVEGNENRISMPAILVDYDFFTLYGIEFISGRPFSESITTDRTIREVEEVSGGSSAYIVNEAALEQFGWNADEAVNRTMEITCCGFSAGPVIGVVRNPLIEPLQNTTGPVAFVIPAEFDQQAMSKASLKFGSEISTESLRQIESVWEAIYPNSAASITILSRNMVNVYENQGTQAALFLIFTLLAIVIALLGLVGLAKFVTETYKRDIAVRRVLGGSALDVTMVYTWRFVKLVILSTVFTWPVSYFVTQDWLSLFAYRVPTNYLSFIGTSGFSISIVALIVGIIVFRTATGNPANVLKQN